MKWAICIYALLLVFPISVSLLWLEDTVVFLASGVAGTIALVTAIVAALSTRKKRRDLAGVIAALFVCLAGIVSVARWDWPLRLAFLASRSALEQAATEVRTAGAFTNKRVGLFYVRRAEVGRRGIACLWVHTDPAGRTGLVQTSSDVLPFNLWSVISLDDRWQLISED